MMTTMPRPVNGQSATLADYEHITSRLDDYLPSPGGAKAMARCSAHEDNRRSLSLGIGDGGRLLLNCLAGCPPEDVARAIGAEMKDLFPQRNGHDKPSRKSGTKPKGNIVATYDYRSATGEMLFQVCRMDPKDFRQRRPDPNARDGWAWNLNGVRRALYRLPELLASAAAATTVYIAEGEKDVDRLAGLGLVATTNAGGAGRRKWLDAYSESLRGRAVVILPDNDDVGREHAAAVARALHGVAASVRVIELPDLPDKGDVSDWLNAGGTRERLEEMAAAAPEWTPPEKPAEGDRVPVEITTREAEVTDQTIEALRRDPDLYHRAGKLVVVATGEAAPQDKIERPAESPRIVLLSLPSLRDRISRRVEFFTVARSEEGDHEKPAHVPRWCAEAVRDRGAYSGIRPLVGVVPSPVLRPDGTVLQVPGYDPATGLLFLPAGDVLPVADRPSRADAIAAADRLLGLVADFPFAEPVHRAGWLAALLTPLARPAFKGCSPMFVIEANVPGAGKSLLADAIGSIAFGRGMPRMVAPRDDDEFRKRVTSLVLAGDPAVLLDNLGTALGCASLDSAITGETWRDRRLSQSEMIEGPLRLVWYATGNNVVLAADTARRILPIRLESREERPEDREGFRFPDLLAHVHGNRPSLLRDALTVLRAFVIAGRPQANLRAWGSFEGWSAIVRHAVAWLGLPDPAAGRVEMTARADVEVVALRTLIEGWGDIDPHGEGLTAAALVDLLEKHPGQFEAVRSALLDICGSPAGKLPGSRSVGNKFRRLRRRVVGGRFLDDRQNRNGIAEWYVSAGRPAGSAGSAGSTSPIPYACGETDSGAHRAHRAHVGMGETDPAEPADPAPWNDATDDDPAAAYYRAGM